MDRRWHEYQLDGADQSGRHGLYVFVAVVALVTAVGIRAVYLALPAIEPIRSELQAWGPVLFVISAVAPTTTFFVLLAVFDRWLWSTRVGAVLCSLSKTARPPMIAGRYPATVDWRRHGEAVSSRKEVVIEIDQTWRKLRIHLEYPKGGQTRAWSDSDMAVLAWSSENSVILKYTYVYQSWPASADHHRLAPVHGGGLQTLRLERESGKLWDGHGWFMAQDGSAGVVSM